MSGVLTACAQVYGGGMLGRLVAGLLAVLGRAVRELHVWGLQMDGWADGRAGDQTRRMRLGCRGVRCCLPCCRGGLARTRAVVTERERERERERETGGWMEGCICIDGGQDAPGVGMRLCVCPLPLLLFSPFPWLSSLHFSSALSSTLATFCSTLPLCVLGESYSSREERDLWGI